MKQYPRFKAAACRAAPVYFDALATVDKACVNSPIGVDGTPMPINTFGRRLGT
jgi:hypothetical protein